MIETKVKAMMTEFMLQSLHENGSEVWNCSQRTYGHRGGCHPGGGPRGGQRMGLIGNFGGQF